MWVTYSTTKALIPTAVALGNFDGLHRGHQRVIQPVLDFVRRHQTGAGTGDEEDKATRKQGDKGTRGRNSESLHSSLSALEERAYSTVVTFNPHPQEFFSGQSRTLLTPLPEKAQHLGSWGIEQLVLLPFDRELAALSPQNFVEKILVQQLHVQAIAVGEDFCFGNQRIGTAINLQAIAAQFGIPVTIVPIFSYEDKRISSSSIRQALSEGKIKYATTLLGRPYCLVGTVVKGQQIGRTIGFPTANIQLPTNKFIPRLGVYAVRVLMAGEKDSSLIPLGNGVMNIGNRPTVNGTQQSVEVHLLEWSGDLYGKTLTVQLEEFLRPEQKFASLEALKAQIAADCTKAKSLLG